MCQLRKKYSQKKEEERNKKIYDFEQNRRVENNTCGQFVEYS